MSDKGFYTVLIKEDIKWELYRLNAWSPTTTKEEDLANMKIFVNGISSALNKPMKIVWMNINESHQIAV